MGAPDTKEKTWETYEQCARWLLDQFAAEFGVAFFEGKQDVTGIGSETSWEIDAKGVRAADGSFLIVECKRWTTSRPSQETLAGLAYRIRDTGAHGGIIVCPLGVQEGAKKVAKAENIFEVRLDENSTPEHFVAHFLNKFRAGATSPLFLCGAEPDPLPADATLEERL